MAPLLTRWVQFDDPLGTILQALEKTSFSVEFMVQFGKFQGIPKWILWGAVAILLNINEPNGIRSASCRVGFASVFDKA